MVGPSVGAGLRCAPVPSLFSWGRCSMCDFSGGSGCGRDKLLCFWYVGLSFSVGC